MDGWIAYIFTCKDGALRHHALRYWEGSGLTEGAQVVHAGSTGPSTHLKQAHACQ